MTLFYIAFVFKSIVVFEARFVRLCNAYILLPLSKPVENVGTSVYHKIVSWSDILELRDGAIEFIQQEHCRSDFSSPFNTFLQRFRQQTFDIRVKVLTSGEPPQTDK